MGPKTINIIPGETFLPIIYNDLTHGRVESAKLFKCLLQDSENHPAKRDE